MALVETEPISITLPATRPPWSTISLTRSAVTEALADRGTFCVVTTWEPSTSRRAPVGERDDEVRGRRDQLPEHRQPGDR